MDLKELEAAASLELQKNGLQNWTFRLSDAKRLLGVCKYRAKRIEISRYYATHSTRESVIDTLLHEIAHALAGHAAAHGPAWKAIAIRLGATPRACESASNVVLQPGDWQATCPSCQKTFHRYKRPKTLNGYRCRCAARSPIVFEFKGDPAFRPEIPLSIQQAAKWEAKCAGCLTVHLKVRRPSAGVWRCRCPQKCELIWQPRSQIGADGSNT